MTDNRVTERVDHPPRVREAIDEMMREKDVAYNRTNELREMLTERGAKWTESRYSGARHAEHTKWTTAGGSHAKYTEYDDGHTVMTIEARNLTPEQAIAATLGEPIIRCRDCRHMHTIRHWPGVNVNECWLHADRESGALGKERTEPDGFCAWAERKEVD